MVSKQSVVVFTVLRGGGGVEIIVFYGIMNVQN